MSAAITALLAALVASSAFAALVAPSYLRNKSRADTVAVLSDTARELVEPLRGEIRELRGEIAVYKQRVGTLERQERESMQVLAAHAAWDIATATAMRSAGLELDAVPPLFPPPRPERTRSGD